MPEAARGNGTELVDIIHLPGQTTTDECSSTVFINGQGVVRQDDRVAAHSPHAGPQPKLSTFSSTVFIEGKGAGRKGDQYECGATIATGSSNVFIG